MSELNAKSCAPYFTLLSKNKLNMNTQILSIKEMEMESIKSIFLTKIGAKVGKDLAKLGENDFQFWSLIIFPILVMLCSYFLIGILEKIRMKK